VPSSDQALVIELADALPICEFFPLLSAHGFKISAFGTSFCTAVDPDVVFWSPEVKVGDPAPFQLTLTAPTSATISSIPFTRLTIFFVDDVCPPIIVNHEDADSTKNMSYHVRRIDLGRVLMNPVEEAVIKDADLRWGLGDTAIFAGFVASERPAKLEVRAFSNCGHWTHSLASDFIPCTRDCRIWVENRNSIRATENIFRESDKMANLSGPTQIYYGNARGLSFD